jgi:hypothetical protein
VSELRKTLAGWRTVAVSRDVGLTDAELETFAPAFDHEQARMARSGLTD